MISLKENYFPQIGKHIFIITGVGKLAELVVEVTVKRRAAVSGYSSSDKF